MGKANQRIYLRGSILKNRISSERVDLFDPNICITMFFDIVGEVDTELLLSAVNKAFTRFEATMSKIVLSDDGEAYYEKIPVSACTVKTTQQDLISLIKENEKAPFSLETGELMRVFVKPSDNKSTVLIMAHHLVGDGKSIIYFIESIMKALIEEEQPYSKLHLITEDSLPKESQLPGWMRWWINGFNRSWKKSGKVFGYDDYYRLHNIYWKERESVILMEEFLNEDVKIIHKKATDAKVSINSYIITAFLKANMNMSKTGLAVNARIDNNRTMSNQASGISIDYAYNDKLPFERNAQEVHRSIYKKLNRPVNKYFILRFMQQFNSSLIDSIMMHIYGLYDNKVTFKLSKIMGYKSGGRTSIGITNLTKIDIENTYKNYHIEKLYFIPPVVSYSRQTVGIVTSESGMTITYHCMSDTYNEEKKHNFEKAMNILLD